MDVAVVGAGLAGLAAAVELHESGHTVRVFEAADRPGGRVQTDEVDGHLLDRGFQVMLSAYPDAAALFDVARLDMGYFDPGAMIQLGGRLHRVSDPFQDPAGLLATLRAPVGSLGDKVRVARFRQSVRRGSVESLWLRPETSALERLRQAGFSATMIERFLRPLFAGITLDPDLSGSSRMLEFVFRMLSAGPVGVPGRGMAAIPALLASRLPDGALSLSSPVRAVTKGGLELDADKVEADAVIVATDASATAELCGLPDPGWRATTTLWLSAEQPPVDRPVLVLNGAGTSPVNSLAVLSAAAPGYAPPGRSTIAVSAPLVQDGLADAMRTQLRQWFGPEADSWETLRVDEIPRAHPLLPLGHRRRPTLGLEADGQSTTDPDLASIWVCGDHLTDPSINGAVASGRAAAAAVLARANR